MGSACSSCGRAVRSLCRTCSGYDQLKAEMDRLRIALEKIYKMESADYCSRCHRNLGGTENCPPIYNNHASTCPVGIAIAALAKARCE